MVFTPAEKMGFGIAISMVIQMLLTVFGAGAAEAQKQRQQQLEMERMRRGYHRMHSARCVCERGFTDKGDTGNDVATKP